MRWTIIIYCLFPAIICSLTIFRRPSLPLWNFIGLGIASTQSLAILLLILFDQWDFRYRFLGLSDDDSGFASGLVLGSLINLALIVWARRTGGSRVPPSPAH